MPSLPRLSLAQIVLILSALVVAYFVFAAIGDTLLSQRLHEDEQQLQQEVAQLRDDQAQLEAIREYLWTDEYVEGEARRLLGLVKEGESLVVVTSGATATPVLGQEPQESLQRRWWERLYIP